MSSPVSTTPAFDASIAINNATKKAATSIATDFSIAVVHQLASKYDFDAEQAIRDLGISDLTIKTMAKKAPKTPKEPKAKWDTPSVILPWCGMPFMKKGFCQGLRLNHGLHSQCTMQAKFGNMCLTCHKQCEKNPSGKPTYGDVTDRALVGILDYRDPKSNKLTVPYANVMDKLKITPEQARDEALRFGLVIPDEHFVVKKAQRGRPKRPASAVDSDGESSPKPKAKRGRPKKAKKVIESATGEDLIASLVAQASGETSPVAKENEVVAKAEKPASPKAKKPASPKAKKAASPKAKKVKKELTEEEKAAKKKLASEKRKAAYQKKKAAKAAQVVSITIDPSAFLEVEDIVMPVLNDDAIEAKKKAVAEKKAKQEAENKAKQEVELKAATLKAAAELKAKQEAENKAKQEAELKAKQEAELKAKQEAELKAKQEAELELELELEDDAETEDEDDDEEETPVIMFKHEGKSYLKDAENTLYDPDTQDEIGTWNEETQTIDPLVCD